MRILSKDEIVSTLRNVQTVTDLYNYAMTRDVQQSYRDCDSGCKETIVEAYASSLLVVADRYKLNELDNIPLIVDTLRRDPNEDGSYFFTLSGIRADTQETVKVRTRSPVILRYFEQHDLPQSIVFIKMVPTGPYDARPFWTVHQLVPLTERKPFRNGAH